MNIVHQISLKRGYHQTFYKQLYKRHTNFALQSVEAQFNGTADFGKRVSVIVPRVGDLMSRTYLEILLPEVTSEIVDDVDDLTINWTHEIGFFLLNNIEIQIGGQIIDKHYSTWMSIWNALTIDAGKARGVADMVGYFDNTTNVIPEKRLYVPLYFWFCRNEGLAVPLIALQYHELRFVVEFERFQNLLDRSAPGIVNSSNEPSLQSVQMWIDYVFLDTDERCKQISAPVITQK